MVPIEIDLTIAAFDGAPSETLLRGWIDPLPAAITSQARLNVPDQAELSVYVSDDEELARLNSSFRGKAGPTNVLSFPAKQVAVGEQPLAVLGDLVFSWPTVIREAEEQEKSEMAHFQHLFVHGLLHLFGYDHISEAEAAEMEQLEVTILASLGLENPYQ